MTARIFQAASFIAAATRVRDWSGILCEPCWVFKAGTETKVENGTQRRDEHIASKDTAESPTA